ncbi:MAG: hypothetical protein R3E64_09620 [Halioglobus sp.]
MNWEAIGAMGEIVGALAVFLTLVYLAIQIRQNTNATRAASHHAVTDALNQLNLSLAENEEVARIWVSGMNDRSSLTDIQRERYDALLRAYMHACDTMYYQAQVGAGDNGLWKAEERYLAVVLTSPGGKTWFEDNSFSISPGFKSALLNITTQYEVSSTDNLSYRYNNSRDSGAT